MIFALILIIVIIISAIIVHHLSTIAGVKMVKKFFDSIKPLIVSAIIDQVKACDLSKYQNSENGIAEFEADFLNGIYVEATKIVVDQIELRKEDHLEYDKLKEKINDKVIKDYTYSLLSRGNTQDRIADLYNKVLATKIKEIEDEDKRLEAEQELYDKGLDNSSDDDIIKEVDIDPERGIEKPESIIPPTDIPNYLYDPDTEDEVSRAEYDSYQLIAHKGIIDTSKRKKKPEKKEED